jgi:hypothetical protein
MGKGLLFRRSENRKRAFAQMAEISETTPTRKPDNDGRKPLFDWTINPTHWIALIAAVFGALQFLNQERTYYRDAIKEISNGLSQVADRQSAKNDLQDAEIKRLNDYNIASKTDETQFRNDVKSSLSEIQKTLTQQLVSDAEQRALWQQQNRH